MGSQRRMRPSSIDVVQGVDGCVHHLPNTLLLSWIAQGGGRGIITLDLLNSTEVHSVASPTHPSVQYDVQVGTLAAKAQTANTQAEGFRELGLMETMCPFQLFDSDGVESLGAESAREHVHWVSGVALFGMLHCCPLFF